MILMIDNYDSFTYNLYQLCAERYPNIHVVRNDSISLSEINALQPAGIIISPGPGRPEDAGISLALINELVCGTLKGTPMLGVCLGHQALVQALGGKIISAGEIIHGKEDDIFHTAAKLYHPLTNPFKAGRYHSLIADKSTLPQALMIQAYNKNNMIMGVKHQHLPLHGVQFHPESILTPQGQRLLQAFINEVEKYSC